MDAEEPLAFLAVVKSAVLLHDLGADDLSLGVDVRDLNELRGTLTLRCRALALLGFEPLSVRRHSIYVRLDVRFEAHAFAPCSAIHSGE